MSKINNKSCNGCILKYECKWPLSLNGKECPCMNCLIKVVCPRSGACEAYREYENFLRITLGSSFISGHGSGFYY